MTRHSAETGLRLRVETQVIKYGRMIVRNADGSFNREVALTRDQYLLLATDPQSVCTAAGVAFTDWTSGRAIATGKQLDLGDCIDVNGDVLAMVRKQTVGGATIETYWELQPGEYTGTAPAITLTEAARVAVGAISVLDGVIVQ